MNRESSVALDELLTLSVGRRHAWPVRWGELRLLPDLDTAADQLGFADADALLLHLVGEE